MRSCESCGAPTIERKCSNCGEEVFTLEERTDFINRFTKRMMVKAGTSKETSEMTAKVIFDDWDKIDTPEDCADEELTYWND